MNPPYFDTPPVFRALQEEVNRELNENSHTVDEDILILRRWIWSQPRLKARTNDQFLLAFLRGCKFSLQRAKQTIDRYYSLRAAIPEVFNEKRMVDNPNVMEIVKMGLLCLAAKIISVLRLFVLPRMNDINKFRFADTSRVHVFCFALSKLNLHPLKKANRN